MRSPFKFGIGVALLSFLGVGLGACTNTDKGAPPPCPSIRIISDGAKLTRFKPGAGQDIIDILHEETLTGFAQGCEYDTDATGAGDLTVWLAPAITAVRGPANKTGDADFEYFIAITDSQKNVLDKQRFPVVVDFPQNLTKVPWQRETPHALNLPLKAGQNGRDFEIFIGLQLNRVELEYLRKTR